MSLFLEVLISLFLYLVMSLCSSLCRFLFIYVFVYSFRCFIPSLCLSLVVYGLFLYCALFIYFLM